MSTFFNTGSSLPDMAARSERDNRAFLKAELAGTRFATADWIAETGSTNDDLAERVRRGGPEQVLITPLTNSRPRRVVSSGPTTSCWEPARDPRKRLGFFQRSSTTPSSWASASMRTGLIRCQQRWNRMAPRSAATCRAQTSAIEHHSQLRLCGVQLVTSNPTEPRCGWHGRPTVSRLDNTSDWNCKTAQSLELLQILTPREHYRLKKMVCLRGITSAM